MTPSRKRWLDIFRYGLLTAVLLAVAIALIRNWSEVSEELRRVGPGAFALGAVGALLSPVFAMFGWRILLADLGSRLHVAEAASVFFVGQLGKYLPGSVWTVVTQTEMAAKLGVPRRRTGVASLVTLALSVLTGGLVAIPALPVLLDRQGGVVPWWWGLVAIVIGAVLLSPPILNRLVAYGLRVIRRPPLEHELSLRATVGAVAWLVLAWVMLGTSVLALARSVAPVGTDPSRLVLVAVCGYSLAAVIGMVGVVLPAGIGLRDGFLVILLGTLMPLPAATAVVIVARFLTVSGDVVVAFAGWAWGRTHHLLPGRRDGRVAPRG